MEKQERGSFVMQEQDHDDLELRHVYGRPDLDSRNNQVSQTNLCRASAIRCNISS